MRTTLALKETFSTRQAVLWSTSRNELWRKGATSGDVLDLVEVRVNCEQNSVLYRVIPRKGGVCHTKDATGQARQTCYYRATTATRPGARIRLIPFDLEGVGRMKLGIFSFNTEYTMPAAELAVACEERGFESLWVPEHTHIPASRETPWPAGGPLPKEYIHMSDPFSTLAAAAAVTEKILLGTGVSLIIEHEPLYQAKQVATLGPHLQRPFSVRRGGRLDSGRNAEPRHPAQPALAGLQRAS